MSDGQAKPPSAADNQAFRLHLPVDFILPAFDVLVTSGYDYISVFGVPFIDLPVYVSEDLRALMRRKAQVEASKPKK